MNLRVCIVPAKVLANGSHKVRIAMSHNSTTRYFLTNYTIPSEKNIKNGIVVGLDNAALINQKIRTQLTSIYNAFDSIENAEYLSCAQLVEEINQRMKKSKGMTFHEVAMEWYAVRVTKDSARRTGIQYSDAIRTFEVFAGRDFVLDKLTPEKMRKYDSFLENKYSESTCYFRKNILRFIINFALRNKYVNFPIDPFTDTKKFHMNVRQATLPIDVMRNLRDMETENVNCIIIRDVIMLSFYLCGMNLVDILKVDLTRDAIRYRRTKNNRSRKQGEYTEFTIQPEARKIIDKYLLPNGTLSFYGRTTQTALRGCLGTKYMKLVNEQLGYDGRIIFYSARKTFSQLANYLGVNKAIIEYCIGDSNSDARNPIGHYIFTNKMMADFAIRKVFDAFASDKSIEEILMEQYKNGSGIITTPEPQQ